MHPASRATTRRTALARLATLSAKEPGEAGDNNGDIERLCNIGRNTAEQATKDATGRSVEAAAVPMSVRELDVLLALCNAASSVARPLDAERLLAQLAAYMPEAHRQALAQIALIPSECPWETLTFCLADAILAIAVRHPDLAEKSRTCISNAIDAFASTSQDMTALNFNDESHKQVQVVQFTTSLVGFLKALSLHVQVWMPEERATLLGQVRKLLSEELMVAVEGGLSAVRHSRGHQRTKSRQWLQWIRQYAAKGLPLGAMLVQRAYVHLAESCTAACIAKDAHTTNQRTFEWLLQYNGKIKIDKAPGVETLQLRTLADIAVRELNLLEADADYLQVSSPRTQRLALETKASCFRTYLYCSVLDKTAAASSVVTAWLEDSINDLVEMSDEQFAQVVLRSMVLLAQDSTSLATSYNRTLPRLIVQGKLTAKIAAVAGQCLAQIFTLLSQDTVISTIYSLGNVLSGTSGAEKAAGTTPFVDANGSTHLQYDSIGSNSHNAMGSTISLVASDEEETAIICGTVVRTIAAIAVACNDDDKIINIVTPLLVQKIGRIGPVVDAYIITETAALALCGGGSHLKALLKFYARVAAQATSTNDSMLLNAVDSARLRLSTMIKKDSPLYEIYLSHLLGLAVSSGDTAGNTRTVDVTMAARTIAQLLRPLAVLVSSDIEHHPNFNDEGTLQYLNRDAWFNLVVHGFLLNSKSFKEYASELQILAQHSLPFIDEERVFWPESGIDLNTVLRRGSNAQSSVDQKYALLATLPNCEADIKGLGYAECVFLNAVLLVCILRARMGDCTFVLPFFFETKVKTLAMSNCMMAIASLSTDTYVSRALAGMQQKFAAPQIALQLATLLEGCCNRIIKVQQGAAASVDRIINAIPSALCQKASIFALLELLSLLWRSCLDAETDEYNWQSSYHSDRGNVTIAVSDDVALRQSTLASFHKRCKAWVAKAMAVAPLDLKGLLQAYLEDFDDDGAYGHIALGRSFALEMGSMIPASDPRLTSIDRQNSVGISTASDFIAQYTTRQAYRAPDSLQLLEGSIGLPNYDKALTLTAARPENITQQLRELHLRLKAHEYVPFDEVREALRSAASCLSRYRHVGISLIQDLVGIPFTMFTKEAIKFGISIWMGITKENPKLQPRVLVEVAAGWEASVHLKRGFFSSSVQFVDPFYVKEEFAPTSKEALSKRQQVVHNLLQPHLRLVNLLSSYFSATRLTSPSVERVYARAMRITMLAMKHTVTQPLARETHFHFVLLALRVLRYSTSLDSTHQWRLKDATLSAGLAWFSTAPKWSFGGNRLQVKAEIKLMSEVSAQLQSLSSIGSKASRPLPSLQPKQELLLQLMSQELSRISVWITPLGHGSSGSPSTGAPSSTSKDGITSMLLPHAWAEDPRLAVQLVTRFHSPKLASDVRRLLLQQPQKAINEPDALFILLGSALPTDVKTQLKYLLYWAPVNPMAAVTYFLPSYGNHPLIIQYAVRALDSHSIDVTFFYVPQIVQALRYDALGYVERYIIEAATFSQLFAHQIIWNMKANAYKDEESQEPDPVKPTLDRVMDALISSFSQEDKDFYEREFDFFGKVTGISGTLKPFIKRPKPEKKQKIEEELRKIQVEVGVYLPSNPDGVIVGIDRKSGKPLQSHAKAPYMATFRIRKELAEIEGVEDQVFPNGAPPASQTYDVWQSAIFKVGDDCRQDVLALQMIAAFRGIFNSAGLDVYVFPYRVTATAPGCGVIDVLPNSISRDMLGREAVNGLYEYFVSKYGNEDSVQFQEARSNFIKSMAAYSIISYLLQFKDRHNGNIMVDDAGHILHIDFGFCFDIAPGGIKFERAPFKLTPEMVAVMGGSTHSQPFKAFEELIVKAFLASRQYVEQLSHIVLTMLDSGLPCFKPQTIQHFKERFVLEKSDREAADFVRKLVHWSERSYSTGVYDYFQLLTNGIPY